jgi:hypothetical protein
LHPVSDLVAIDQVRLAIVMNRDLRVSGDVHEGEQEKEKETFHSGGGQRINRAEFRPTQKMSSLLDQGAEIASSSRNNLAPKVLLTRFP